jgi:Zn-dependent protease
LFGIPITIEPYFWLTAMLLNFGALTGGAEAVPGLAAWLFTVLVSVLWHELGHALSYKLFGCRSEIVLHGFGGHTVGIGGAALPRGKSIVVSLAGCAFGLSLWFVLIKLMETGVIPPFQSLPQGGRLILFYMLEVNLVWSLLNLIPMYPLDGGQVLFALFGRRRMRAALIVTIGVGVICCVIATILGSYYLLLLPIMMTYQNYERLKQVPR